MNLNIKNKLVYLIDCRDKEEVLVKLKSAGIEVSEEEIEAMRELYNSESGTDNSALNIEQLSKVAGGYGAKTEGICDACRRRFEELAQQPAANVQPG